MAMDPTTRQIVMRVANVALAEAGVAMFVLWTFVLWLTDEINGALLIYRASLFIFLPHLAGLVGYFVGRRSVDKAIRFHQFTMILLMALFLSNHWLN